MGILTYNKSAGYTGWLGNRMFQIASSIGIATKNGLEYKFPEKEFPGAEYYHIFKGPIPTADLSNLNSIDYYEKEFHYEDIKLLPEYNYNLLGYYQSEKYFKHCEKLIREIFTFNEDINSKACDTLKQIRQSNVDKVIVAIHFRFGDYLNLKHCHTCLTDTDYYEKALTEILTKYYISSRERFFIVFSDNHELAEQYMDKMQAEFASFSYVIVKNNTQADDMCLMSLCDVKIIANSSFSWWGAWLRSYNPEIHESIRDNIVISPGPDRWFGPDRKDWNKDDLYPEGWILI